MEPDVRMRLRWVQMYLETRNAGVACRRCGISRPTLRTWVSRFGQEGLLGTRVFAEREQWNRELRTVRKLGARRIQTELIRLYNFYVSLVLS